MLKQFNKTIGDVHDATGIPRDGSGQREIRNPLIRGEFGVKGVDWIKKGDYDRAIANYDRAIWLQPDYIDAYYNRGLAYSNKGDYDRAIADLEKVLELSADPGLRQRAEEQLEALR